MTVKDALDIIQSGGALGGAVLIIWALLTRRVVTRGEFDRLDARMQNQDRLLTAANDELRKQSATNARLVELSFQHRSDVERFRKAATESRAGEG